MTRRDRSDLNNPPPIAGRSGKWFQFAHEGQHFTFWVDDRRDSLQDYIVRQEDFYEVEALQLIRAILPAKARIVDVGANIGNHAIYFDCVCGAEAVFVIEPNADVVADLRANVAANGCKAIDLSMTGFAVGAEAGSGTLFISASDDAIRNRGGVSVTQGSLMAGQTVPIRRIDDLDLGRIDFIKIDVEGGALGVLQGARELLARWRPSIFVEVDLPDLPCFTGWIRDNNYDVSAAVEYHPGIVNFLILPRSGTAADGVSVTGTRLSDSAGGQQWSSMVAEKRRADRSEETLAIAIVAMRNADARATEAERRAICLEADLRSAAARADDHAQRATIAEGRALQFEADLHDALARAADAETDAAAQGELRRIAEARVEELQSPGTAHLAVSNSADGQRSVLQRLFFRTSGKPKKLVRKLLFHTSGRPRGTFKSLVVNPDGSPRAAYHRWMTSPEYLSLPDNVRAGKAQLVAREGKSAARKSKVPLQIRHSAKRVLFIDADYPDPRRDSGSVDTINYLSWLGAIGYHVLFLSTRYLADEKAESAVIACGAKILHLSSEKAVTDYLHEEGHGFDLFFLSRVHCGGRFFEACHRSNPHADVVFNTVDLHHVREDREAQLAKDRAGVFRAQLTRERELYVAGQSDLTIVVSGHEKEILETAVPGAKVALMPLFRQLSGAVPGFRERNGIGFVGGFAHVPNVDALQYFLATIWPKVHAADPCIEFEIAGPGLPDDLAQSLPTGVMYRGQVADLEGWLAGLRLTIAPLRYGAGAKGKVASSIANGVPVVGTCLAFEGMSLGPDAVLATDDAEEMAREIARIHSDEAAWNRLSQGARAFATANLSLEAGLARFAALISSLPNSAAHAHLQAKR